MGGSVADLDQEMRDPNNLNDHIRIAFDEVLGEPESVRSADCVWKGAYNCFNCWKSCWYSTLTLLCGIPCAMCWGCHFACVAFCHVWHLTPTLRAFEIDCHYWRRYYSICTKAVCEPCCEACGNVFNAFKK